MTVAQTRYGQVRGAEIADGILAWRGIPYARPPIGALRFRPPEPPEPWSGVRDALEYGNRSPQAEPVPGPAGAADLRGLPVPQRDRPRRGGRPTCAVLAARRRVRDRPGPQAGRDGVAFARSHGLVVVTVNYRLGALGFLDVPGERPTGAAGLHDQIAALRWTHENIAGFGGDPRQITVYGLSAGAKSVTNLLASPLDWRHDRPRGRVERRRPRQGRGAVEGAHRAVPARARRRARAAPLRVGRRPTARPTGRRGDAALHLDLAAVHRRRRADRESTGRDRGRLSGRDTAATADLRARGGNVRAARGRRPTAGGPGAQRVLRAGNGGELLAGYAAPIPAWTRPRCVRWS